MKVTLKRTGDEVYDDIEFTYFVHGEEDVGDYFEKFKVFMMALGYMHISEYEMELPDEEDDISK